MNDSKLKKCQRCGKEVEENQLTEDKSRENLICLDCKVVESRESYVSGGIGGATVMQLASCQVCC